MCIHRADIFFKDVSSKNYTSFQANEKYQFAEIGLTMPFYNRV